METSGATGGAEAVSDTCLRLHLWGVHIFLEVRWDNQQHLQGH